MTAASHLPLLKGLAAIRILKGTQRWMQCWSAQHMHSKADYNKQKLFFCNFILQKHYVLMQRQLVISSLEEGVVSLIRDLNGNHVIQRCLQRLGPEDSQFVYDAACAHTMEIATHRHGCCVLQRCIDFATPVQKKLLVAEIAANALPLSQVRKSQYVQFIVRCKLSIMMPWTPCGLLVSCHSAFAV